MEGCTSRTTSRSSGRLEKLINFPDLGQIAKVCLVSALP